MKQIILVALAISMLSSCGNPKPKELHVVDAVRFAPPVVKADDEVMAKMADDAPAAQPITGTAKKIIKNGDVSFETNNVSAARKKILTSLKNLGGYIAEDNETRDDDRNRQEYTLKLRLPAKNFGLLLDSVSSTASKIDSKNISIKDVTSQFIDIKAQLANSKALENTYLGLLNKAGKMGDVLQIENKLTEIRTEIDSTQGSLNYLSRQVAYSSLDVTFYTKQAAAENGNSMGARLRDAIANGWGTLQNLFFGLISLWPLILLMAFFCLLVRRWRRKRRQRKQTVSA